MAKSKKIEKETRRLIEGITDLVKKKGDRYRFKSKSKKTRKMVGKKCPHYIFDKNGKHKPTVVTDDQRPGYWRCTICNASFPIEPATDYMESIGKVISYVNQMQFWSVSLGGDADDTKMFLKLRELLPRFQKVSKQICKQVNKRDQLEKNRMNSDIMQQFNAYTGFNYR